MNIVRACGFSYSHLLLRTRNIPHRTGLILEKRMCRASGCYYAYNNYIFFLEL